jgi:branched-chain amino acid transport system ATP-binding protein
MGFFKVKNLSKHFGGMKAVDGLNIEVNRGEILSLIGPNGAGKTTVFNLITAFIKPTAGSITFQNEDITQLKTHKIASKGIIRIFQQNNLYLDMSVLDNLSIAHHLECSAGLIGYFLNSKNARNDQRKFEESSINIMEYFQLIQYKDETVRNLSHGHKRAMAMANALAAHPTLLLLDEPFSGLNPDETETAMQMVRGIRDRGTTIILVEHDMRAVRGISDRIVAMSFGKKIAEGIPEVVLQDTTVINAYLGEKDGYLLS